MASSARDVSLLGTYHGSGREEFKEQKPVKRVSFLEDDMVVTIPSNEELESSKTYTTISRCISGPTRSRISSLSHTTPGLARAGANGSLKSQTQRRLLRAGENGSLRSKEKQVKSILKKSSTESCLQKSRFYDPFRGESHSSINYNVKVNQQDQPNIKTKLNSSFYVRNNEGPEGSHSYNDFLKRQTRGNTESQQQNTGPYFSKNSFSPTRTLVQRHGNLSVARPLTSTSPEEQYRKSDITKLTPSVVRNCKNDSALGVVGNMLNVSDLYPVLSNLQRNSLSSSDSSLFKHQGVGGRYIPARELISRSGSNTTRHTRNPTQNPAATVRSSNYSTQSNVSARASSGLGRAAELSLLSRLRKFERNDPPYIAWQSSERNIHSSPNATYTIPTRATSLTSVYGGSMGSRVSTVLEKTPSSVLRSPSSQYYY